jgi:Fe2+ or Zn2+ uptake regulation protein/uncharacterized coiled-coil protein SlyX
MMGKALMTDVSNSKLESVLSGIRGYLNGQLAELEDELDTAQRSARELSEQLAAQQASGEALVASRDLLVAKLAELDGAVTDSTTVAGRRKARQKAAGTVPASVVAAVEGDAPLGSFEAEAPGEPSAPATLNAHQREVLGFLETTPGVHKVTEIAAAVSGPEATPAAVQAIRRSLGVLTVAGLATKSTQSGTAFYSAPEPTTPVAAKPRKAATKKAAAKKAVAEKAVAEKPAKAARSKAAKPAKAPAAKPADDAAAKPVRADRAKIVATLLVAEEPQSAAELSRTLMGDDWKSSDATNFRNVLKSLTAKGFVIEHRGEDNRARYTAVNT